MRKEEKLSAEEWLRLGAVVKLAYMAVMEASCMVMSSVGKTSKAGVYSEQAYKKFSECKCKLDDLVCYVNHYNDMFGEDDINVFYGKCPEGQKEMAKEFAEHILGMIR